MKRVLAATVVIASCCLIAMREPRASEFRGMEEIEFSSRGARLSGSLVFPRTGRIVAAVVFVHGSGRQQRDLALAERFAAQGIAALVYDKRGVGRSAGVFVGTGAFSEANLSLLADDAAAAHDALARHPRLRGVSTGLVGLSQAGWIVPIAATRSSTTAFIGLWSGCVCRVSEEDIYSQYTSDRDFAQVPAFADVLRLRRDPYVWSMKFGKDTDASESLRKLDVPGLWIFGANDGSIPVDLSIARLRSLEGERPDRYEYVVFSGLGHATIDDTFDAMVSWIKRAAGNRTVARGAGPLGSAELRKYFGVYASNEPRIEVVVTGRDDVLTLQSKSETAVLTYLGAHSFLGHEVGKGYFFLDFEPSTGRLTISEQGFMYGLQRRR
jgi:uncharacterized protein